SSLCLRRPLYFLSFFFFTHTPPPDIYTLSLHDALPISLPAGSGAPLARPTTGQPQERDPPLVPCGNRRGATVGAQRLASRRFPRSEEHTSELQSRGHLVCRLLLEKKKKIINKKESKN